MFNPFDHEDPDLDEAIASAYTDLRHHKAHEDEYSRTVRQISELYALKNQTAQLNLQAQQSAAAQQLAEDQNAWSEEQADLPFYQRVDPNTVLTVLGNVFIGLAVIKYEQTGVISSKVMTFMRKI